MPLAISLEKVLLALTGIVGAGFLLGETEFAKVGIPLPIAGNSTVTQPSLFVFELFLILNTVIVVAYYAWKNSLPRLHLAQYFLFGFLCVMGARILLELPTDPLVVIRSSSFVWYLSLSLLVSVLPVSNKSWEKLFYVFAGILFLNLAFSVWLFISVRFLKVFPTISWFFFEYTGPRWGLAIGVYGAYAYLVYLKRRVSFIGLAVIGLGLGIELSSKLSRTNLIGLLLVTILLLSISYREPKILLLRLFKVIFVGGVAFLFSQVISSSSWYHEVQKTLYADYKKEYYEKNITPPSNPLVKSNSGGAAEGFRIFMWKDALALFQSHPLWGIGFRQQVVHRFYVGGEKQFLPNTGIHFEPVLITSPIAGPHNSYLNALARLGVVGILFLIFHLAAFWLLVRERYYASAFALAGGMLYASFNVGLEGPARSFFILIALGVALKIPMERKNVAASL